MFSSYLRLHPQGFVSKLVTSQVKQRRNSSDVIKNAHEKKYIVCDVFCSETELSGEYNSTCKHKGYYHNTRLSCFITDVIQFDHQLVCLLQLQGGKIPA